MIAKPMRRNAYAIAVAPVAPTRQMAPVMQQRAQMVKEAHQHLSMAVPEYKSASPRQRMMMTQEHIRTRMGKR